MHKIIPFWGLLFLLLGLICKTEATEFDIIESEATEFNIIKSTEFNIIDESSIMEPALVKQKLRHVVLFKFKDTATEEDILEVEAAFLALPGKIPLIKDFEWGTNNSPEGLDKGFTHSFLLTFDSEEDRDAYLPHPDHEAFGAVLSPYLEDVLVIDYWAQ